MSENGYFAIDIGNMNSLIAYKDESNSITIGLNQAGKRQTPTIFVKTEDHRFFGNIALSYKESNLDGSVENFKLFVAQENNHKNRKRLREITKTCQKGKGDHKYIQLNIRDTLYTIEEIIAYAIKELASYIPKPNYNYISVVVPTLWDNEKRQVIINAVKIAGFHLVKLVNSSIAQAADFLYRNQLTDDKQKYGCFVDCGHTDFIISFVKISRQKIKLLASQQIEIGGQDFTIILKELILDELIEDGIYTDEIIDEILKDYTLNSRFTDSARKTKEALSVSDVAVFEFIGYKPEHDVKKFVIKRKKFEKKASECIQAIKDCAENCYNEAIEKIGENDIEIFEIHGGSGRIPKIRQVLTNMLDIEPTQFLNVDECIVEGALYASAFDNIKVIQKNFDSLGMFKNDPPENVMDDKTISEIRKKMDEEQEKESNSTETDDAHQLLQQFAFKVNSAVRRNELGVASDKLTKSILEQLGAECERFYEESAGIRDAGFYNEVHGWWEMLYKALFHLLVVVSSARRIEPNTFQAVVLREAFEDMRKVSKAVKVEIGAKIGPEDDAEVLRKTLRGIPINSERATQSCKNKRKNINVSQPYFDILRQHKDNLIPILEEAYNISNVEEINKLITLKYVKNPAKFFAQHIY